MNVRAHARMCGGCGSIKRSDNGSLGYYKMNECPHYRQDRLRGDDIPTSGKSIWKDVKWPGLVSSKTIYLIHQILLVSVAGIISTWILCLCALCGRCWWAMEMKSERKERATWLNTGNTTIRYIYSPPPGRMPCLRVARGWAGEK